jgi:hypothetical protein
MSFKVDLSGCFVPEEVVFHLSSVQKGEGLLRSGLGTVRML